MSLRVLALEPYYGGSHRAFLDGLAHHSRHTWTLLTMPPRKWKWRMRGAALSFAPQLDEHDFDLLLVSDFLDLASLVALRPARLATVPKVAYFHENQLTYPVQHEDQRDYQYGFTNVTTCLAADRVFFNSAYHRQEFLDAADGLLRRMPDEVPAGVAEAIAQRSAALPLGCDLRDLDVPAEPREGPAVVLWNHRWEYDKGPEDFFSVLFDLAEEKLPFRLAVAGKAFREAPVIFDVARRHLAEHVVHWGFVEDRAAYARLLRQADIVVSTARHEFFGIAIVEALSCGCFPLLPQRLTYPELLDCPALQATHLYADIEDLGNRLRWAITHVAEVRQTDLSRVAARYDWSARIGAFDDAFQELATAR